MFRHILAGACALSLASGIAAAQTRAGTAPPQPGQVTFNVRLGADIPFDGDLHGAATVALPDISVIDPTLPAVPATLAIDSSSAGDVYDAFGEIGLELGWGLSRTSEVFLSASYLSADTSRVTVGTLTSAGLGGSFPIVADFQIPDIFLIEGGIRVWFADMTNWLGFAGTSPYLGLRGGLVVLDAVDASFSAPGSGVFLPNVRLYDHTTTWTAGVELGWSWLMAGNALLTVQTGVRYTAAPDDDDADLGPLGLAAINEDGERWSVPVALRLTLPFQ